MKNVSTSELPKKKSRRAEKSYSVKVTYNKFRIKVDGTAAVCIQVIIDREKWLLNLNTYWPHDLIYDRGVISRMKNDPLQRDVQLLVDQRLAKINEIMVNDRLGNQDLTIEKLKDKFLNFDGRKDFIKFMSSKIEYRYKSHLIQHRTYQNNKSVLERIIEFQSQILYRELTEDLFLRLGSHLKSKGYKNNYIASIFKDFKKYIRLAKKDGVRFEDITPFVKSPNLTRSLVYLTDAELDRLYELFRNENLDGNLKNVLHYFLFSVETGVRISDISLLRWDHIDENLVLSFIPYKTRGLEKRIQIPLTQTAYKLINGLNGKLFECATDQNTNKLLKRISVQADIKKKLTFHVARHTFATRFLSKGGRVEVLQKLLGHTKIDTTMIYVHVDISRVKGEMLLMETDRKL